MSKVAIVHDWLTGVRGGERVLLEFLKLYPQADIYTLIHVPGSCTHEIEERVKQQSFLGRLPFSQKCYRYMLPLFPWATSSLNLNNYDLVISLSHAIAKNVNVPKDIPHYTYCFTPMRYIWDQTENYFGKFTNLMFPLLNYLQKWDQSYAKNITKFSVISKFIAARVRKYYQRKSEVIYPPVNTNWIQPISRFKKGDAFLYAGALVPYKNPHLVVQAFNHLKLPLIVAGSGPMLNHLKSIAGNNIYFEEKPQDRHLAELYRNCRALIFPAVEDFGMIPVECMSAGRPVIGLDRGGLKESLTASYCHNFDYNRRDYTGLFINSRTDSLLPNLIKTVNFFTQIEESISPQSCIERSKKFNPQVFIQKWELFCKLA